MSKYSNRVWATLLTKTDYLAGCFVLAKSLKLCKSKYPLVVLITPSLPTAARQAVKAYGLEMRMVDYLEPAGGYAPSTNQVDHRFRDTWTKLAVFGVEEYERIVLLDSDMLVKQNMDELMSMSLPDHHIAAVHACTCNPRQLAHYPRDWKPENCAHTAAKGTIPPPITDSSPPTFQLLNSGLVVLQPSMELYRSMVARLHNDPIIQTFIFPDQDFLALYFKDRWQPLGYQYNSLKTMQHCHAKLWKNEDVKNVHYIIDKPWTQRPSPKDLYFELHSWWWETFDLLAKDFANDSQNWSLVLTSVGPSE